MNYFVDLPKNNALLLIRSQIKESAAYCNHTQYTKYVGESFGYSYHFNVSPK
jgi:hypothetical protein